MTNAVEKAHKFLQEAHAFRLGSLLTESAHPKTLQLSQTARQNLPDAIRLLQSVDDDIPPVVHKTLQSPAFQELCEAFYYTFKHQKIIFFTGCGATGRLSILLEAAWRRFWRQLKNRSPSIARKLPDVEENVVSVMAGGDYALIKAVEGFEDFPDFGKYQLTEAGVQPDDMVVAITEGGETPFVIGAAWQGLASDARVFFVYNNPTDLLRQHVQRSREIIDEPRIQKIDLTTGPMAVTGSTRMQAVTIELIIVVAALEIALEQFLRALLSPQDFNSLGLADCNLQDYHTLLVNLLRQLNSNESVQTIAAAVAFERDIYHQKGLLTYLTNSFLLDVLTDTTERSPTFMLPPFRPIDDARSAQSWAMVKNPFYDTRQAWFYLLQREPRGLTWGPDIYRRLDAPAHLRDRPPKLDKQQIYQFQIGSEPDNSRTNCTESTLITISVDRELNQLQKVSRDDCYVNYKNQTLLHIGSPELADQNEKVFQIPCDLSPSSLQLWHHVAIKLILNTLSTATMAVMGRVVGNAMAWVSPSNNKLIDRGARLIAQLTGCSYERACIELHLALEQVELMSQQHREPPSPAVLAIEKIRG
jgi:N-acetylmuramic acid 6-phosphate etherase